MKTFSNWKRDLLRQYPRAIIETQREGRRVVAARATYDYRVVLGEWTYHGAMILTGREPEAGGFQEKAD